MSTCLLCLPALIVPSQLPSLPNELFYRCGELEGFPYFVVEDVADWPQSVGWAHHSSQDALKQSAKECPICRMILEQLKDFINCLHELDKDAASRYRKLERVGHGLPTRLNLSILQRPDGADGFAVLSNSINGRFKYVVAVIGLCADPGASPGTVRGQRVICDARSTETLQLASSWLQACVQNHECCRPAIEKLPSRVIDLDAFSSSSDVRLLHTAGIPLSPYVALSHCWGSSPSDRVMTTRATLPERLHSIAFDTLPRSFQDAIKVARHLGIRYLWIDSLCICQDDPDDWARESAAMAEVYSGAYVVIAAESAGETSQTFLTRADREYEPITLAVSSQQYVTTGDSNSGIGNAYTSISGFAFNVPRLPAISSREWLEFRSEPLAKRAWTLQERSLPYRVLHFATSQLYFECNYHFLSEDGVKINGRLNSLYPGGKASFLPMTRLSDWSDIHRLWYLILENYTGRRLTVETDRFPAISGLAKLIKQQMNARRISQGDQHHRAEIEYVAGLWSDALVEGLTWTSYNLYKEIDRLPTEGPFPGDEEYIAPTWSWASAKSMSGHGQTKNGYVNVATATSWSVTPKNLNNPFGELIDGWIALKAPLIRLQLSELPERDHETLPTSLKNTRMLRLCTLGGDPHGYCASFDYFSGQTDKIRNWAKQTELFGLVLSKAHSEQKAADCWIYNVIIVTPCSPKSTSAPGTEYFRRLGKLLNYPFNVLGDDEKIIQDPSKFSNIVLV